MESHVSPMFVFLQSQLEDLKHNMGATLSERYSAKEKGTAKVMLEHERIRKELLQVDMPLFFITLLHTVCLDVSVCSPVIFSYNSSMLNMPFPLTLDFSCYFNSVSHLVISWQSNISVSIFF